MKIENNLIKSDDYSSSDKLYAITILLKSGSMLYLSDLKQGEKDAYLSYATSDRDEIMILKLGTDVWRLKPEDIERIYFESYSKSSLKASSFGKLLLAESFIPTSVYLRLIKIAIILVILNFILGGIKIFTSGKPMETLMNGELMFAHISQIMSGIYFVFFLFALVMFAMNILDFLFETSPKYMIDREFRNTDTGRLNNIIALALYTGIGYLVIFILGNVLNTLFGK